MSLFTSSASGKQAVHCVFKAELDRRDQRFIADNGLKPGDPLPPEGALAQQLPGIGRNSVRKGVKALEIVEVQLGESLSEDDIERLTDDDGRGWSRHAALYHGATLHSRCSSASASWLAPGRSLRSSASASSANAFQRRR